MPIVSARALSKSYGPQILFSDIALTIRTGERVGLLGANGAGKSTLLRILAGLETSDQGTVERRRGVRIRYLAQEPVLAADQTPRQIVERGLSEWHAATERYSAISRELERAAPGAETALLEEQATLTEAIEHLGGWSRDHVAREMLAHLGVAEIDRPVGTMSGGERRRVALAELLVSEPDLAVLDEPTNHLDTETIEWLEEYLATGFKGAVLMVTHDRYVLDAVADRVLELDQGKITEFSGGYADYLDQKAELLAHAERVEQNRLNLLRREKAWLERGAKARTTKQKARVQRAEALLETKARREAARASFAGLESAGERTGKTIVDLEDVRLDVPRSAEGPGRTLISGLTLRMVPGERIGVLGKNGVGKTTLLKVIAGELTPTSGKIVRGQNTRIVYFDQSRSNLRDDWSVFDNVAEREGADRSVSEAVKIGDRTMEMRTYLEQFLFEGSKQRQKVGALSGGERARVALAKALKTGANLLLLDEPTNDLDVSTLGALEELLEGWPGCAIIVSHDRYFLDRVATSTLAFEGDGKVTRYAGGYESYRLQKGQADAAEADERKAAEAIAVKAAAPTAKRSAAGPKPLTFAERKELDGILDAISELEEKVNALGRRLADPTLYEKGPEEPRRVQAEHDAAAAALQDKSARWEELESRRDLKK